MPTQLSATELQAAQSLLHDYAPAQSALATLAEQDGDLEASLTELVAAEAGTVMYGAERDRLWAVFLRNLRREVCGDDSFHEKVESYSKSPDKGRAFK